MLRLPKPLQAASAGDCEGRMLTWCHTVVAEFKVESNSGHFGACSNSFHTAFIRCHRATIYENYVHTVPLMVSNLASEQNGHKEQRVPNLAQILSGSEIQRLSNDLDCFAIALFSYPRTCRILRNWGWRLPQKHLCL